MTGVPSALTRLVLVAMATAVALRALDSVPSLLTGLPRGVMDARSVDELRDRTGLALVLPSVYPADLEWPPGRALYSAEGHTAVLIRQTRSRAVWLIIATAPVTAPVVSPALLPPAEILQDADVDAPTAPLRVQRLGLPGGVVWHQATWVGGGRRIVLRYRGPVTELLRIAESLRRRSPS